jgi:sterol desaturase/sphingolipid hydroxylase (fatty acid hydroxylase superfamily)
MNKTGFFISLIVLGWLFLSGLANVGADTRGFLFALAAPLIVFGLEIVVLGWSQSSLYRILFKNDHSQRIDLLLFAVHVTNAMTILTLIFSLGCSYLLGQTGQILIRGWTGMNLRIDTGSSVLNFAIYYILFSFLEYWSHRLFHMEPLWHLHKIHHSATSLNPLVMHRAHPANLFLDPLFRNTLPIALVAAPGPALAALFVVNSFHQLLVHSSAPWDWGWFGKWVLLSPKGHKIHHSVNPEHYGKNISTDLVIWDHLFGTWYTGDVPVEAVGLTESHYDAGNFIVHCVRDTQLFLAAFGKRCIAPRKHF